MQSWPRHNSSIAREYGFSSWRALKAELDLRRAPNVAEFRRACAAGDLDTLRDLLQKDPALARERLAGGTTGLHSAVRHPQAVRLLIEHGADPNARDVGDNATPLHFAAGGWRPRECSNPPRCRRSTFTGAATYTTAM